MQAVRLQQESFFAKSSARARSENLLATVGRKTRRFSKLLSLVLLVKVLRKSEIEQPVLNAKKRL